ncbi:Phosphoribosylamine--glycine ligase [Candidatus Erwinia haradaeae]|uniref:Phosphoribosylamine--glycine ligase n=1 Tax=Candidatus Erwinia haradaeae TaxID=1922217 RepID=A0A451DKP1_9GAMM|nr:phosphoribosylamine--glycine ligase [Candidatus Erwinia haradaeae]VFP87289.1 Phosphoribosylamine--glycine ligase [Candidatus Erwinia haradaeae]
MKILVIGSGAREHALAWKISQSKLVTKIFVAPGNAGTLLEPMLHNIPIQSTNLKQLLSFAITEEIDLTIVGPEAPLLLGIVDIFSRSGLKIFGPTQEAALLEGSKVFSKNFLVRHGIPTAAYNYFTEVSPALQYVRERGVPIVIKVNGLASGKGVIIANTLNNAEAAIKNILCKNAFGPAGNCILVEEFLEGEEVSFIVMVDGKNILPMATTQDYKRVGNNNTGLNTGGMGAYSPVPEVTDAMHQRIMTEIIRPTIHGMMSEGTPYTGFLYAGLMIDRDHQIKVIEFNCRLGDPESQPIMLRLKSDLLDLCLAAINRELDQRYAIWDSRPSVGVVLASGGYPGEYVKGYRINGLPRSETLGCKVFHAGTAFQDGAIVTDGGRVLCVTSLGENISVARHHAYQIADMIFWKDKFCRTDIASRAIEEVTLKTNNKGCFL